METGKRLKDIRDVCPRQKRRREKQEADDLLREATAACANPWCWENNANRYNIISATSGLQNKN